MNQELQIAIAGGLVLAVIMGLVVIGPDLGFESELTTDYIMLLPGILVFVVGLYMLTTIEGIYQMPTIIVIGISLAYMVGSLNTLGYISSELASGLTVSQIQLWVLFLSTLTGALVGVFK